MKRSLFTLLVLLFIVFSGCRKGERLFDKRNKLTGKFEMTVERFDWAFYSSTTYEGEVSYSRKEHKNGEIVIRYADNETFTLVCDDHNNLTFPGCDNSVGSFSPSGKKFNLEIFYGDNCGNITGGSKKVRIAGKRK